MERPDRTEQYHPLSSLAGKSSRDHLCFSLRYEAFDLRVLIAAFEAMDGEEIAAWVREEPVGAYSRRGGYVDALDARLHVVSSPVNSPRHRVRGNLLGNEKLYFPGKAAIAGRRPCQQRKRCWAVENPFLADWQTRSVEGNGR